MNMNELLIKQGLNHRQSEVTTLVYKGLSNKECGEILFVTEQTIKFHMVNIFKILKLKNRTQLIRFVYTVQEAEKIRLESIQ